MRRSVQSPSNLLVQIFPYSLKILIFNLIFCIVPLIFPEGVLSQENYNVNLKSEYILQESLAVSVKYYISIENLTSTTYASSYRLLLENLQAKDFKVTESGSALKFSEENTKDVKNIIINFEKPVVGKGEIRNFVVEFTDPTIVKKTGEIWEVTIPKLSNENSFNEYSLVLSVPKSLGGESYVYPYPESKVNDDNNIIYFFKDKEIIDKGLTAGFGEFQVYSFNLTYHLKNNNQFKDTINIALPPDTSYQKVFYDEITPAPINVETDADGNWLAKYLLKRNERLDVKVSGKVYIFSVPKPLKEPPGVDELLKYTKPTEYWHSDSDEIKKIAQELKTVKNIYDYVVDTLFYDYSRVEKEQIRLGSINALQNPNSATCMEFTDLFIALARAASIPAREINGFAYTENPQIQPLSLVNDVLHSWPQYYSQEKRSWISIDPTWAKTTGGVDYFEKLDLRHFTFVIHGEDPLKPYPPGSYKLGNNPQKDVYISFSTPHENITYEKPKVVLEIKKNILEEYALLTIINPNRSAIDNVAYDVYFSDHFIKGDEISVIPPYGFYEYKIKIPKKFLILSGADEVRAIVAGESLMVKSSKYQIPLTLISLLLLLSTLLILRKLGYLKKRRIIHIDK